MRFISEFYITNGIPHILTLKVPGKPDEIIDIKIMHDLEQTTRKILHTELPKEAV